MEIWNRNDKTLKNLSNLRGLVKLIIQGSTNSSFDEISDIIKQNVGITFLSIGFPENTSNDDISSLFSSLKLLKNSVKTVIIRIPKTSLRSYPMEGYFDDFTELETVDVSSENIQISKDEISPVVYTIVPPA